MENEKKPMTLDGLYRTVEQDTRDYIATLETVVEVTDLHRPLIEQAAVLAVRMGMTGLRRIACPDEDSSALRVRLADELTEVLARLALLPEADQIPARQTRRKARA